MTLEEWIAETEAERPERALWPSETDARRFRDVWCTGRLRPTTMNLTPWKTHVQA